MLPHGGRGFTIGGKLETNLAFGEIRVHSLATELGAHTLPPMSVVVVVHEESVMTLSTAIIVVPALTEFC